MEQVDFKKIVSDAGIPTTEDALKQEWQDQMDAAGSSISNDNKYSPFWRTITALVTSPTLWLIDFLVDTVLPNAFLKTANLDWAVDLLADAVNLTRKDETKAKGVITFTRDDTGTDVTIEAGTVIQTATLNGNIYKLVTTAQASFTPGSPTLDVAVEAIEAGAAFNLAAGYYSILAEPIANITGVTNGTDWLTEPGADLESNDDLRNRARNQFGTASDFHTDSVYRSLIAEFPGVAVDAIYFEHDAPRGPGTANAFVLFDFAAPVTTYLADINSYITDDGNHGHGDDLQVFQMPEQTISLVATVWHEQGMYAADITALQANITDFINAAFRENSEYSPTLTLPYARFSFSRLGQELHREFAEIHSVDFDLADIVTALWIPRLTSLTVNLQETE